MMRVSRFLFLCFTLNIGLLFAQDDEFGLFDKEDVLELELRLDLDVLQKDRITPDYQNAWLTGNYTPDIQYKMKVQVKARGNFRRSDVTCQFPPLRVRFSKKDNLGPFEGDRKLKLVTHCQDEKFVLREYLVYKTYQLISPNSLRVRLCRITYEDMSGKYETETHYAFFIEDLDTFAESHDSEEVKEETTPFNEIDREQLTLIHIFQYMIGNPDHSADRQKNVKLMVNKSKKLPPVPIPYDFDWSGIVDASYTKIPGAEKSQAFKRRKFKPLCRTPEEFEEAFDIFRNAKEKIFDLYERTELLSDDDKNTAIKYYKEFYKTINKKGKVKKIFLGGCEE